MSPNSIDLVARDLEAVRRSHDLPPAKLVQHAARKSGRHVLSIGFEAGRMRRSKARIALEEYVAFRLYDRNAFTEDERKCFVGWIVHHGCVMKINDVGWFRITEDKWNSAIFLAADGLPIPDTVSVIDPTSREYQGIRKADRPERLREVLTSADATFPLFGKFNSGQQSVGVFAITQADRTTLELRDHGALSYEEFFERFVGGNSFILQRFVRNHSFFAPFTETTATVRMVNMLTEDGLWTPAAVLKLPSSRNQADNFWRDGNLLCNLDPETGEILRVVGHEGFDLVEHDAHPETGQPLLGQRLPHWERLREVNERVAWLHTPLRYQSTDIAITDDGPVVIEVNFGSSFSLPQAASGKGFMTPEVRRLFRAWGADMIWE